MFDGKDSGALNHPVTVTSYGEGRATICSGSNDGLWAFNCAGLVVQNLNFVGSGATDSTGGTVIFHRLMADALIKMFTLAIAKCSTIAAFRRRRVIPELELSYPEWMAPSLSIAKRSTMGNSTEVQQAGRSAFGHGKAAMLSFSFANRITTRQEH